MIMSYISYISKNSIDAAKYYVTNQIKYAIYLILHSS